MITFETAQILVNNSGIVADTVSLSTEGTSTPVFVAGSKQYTQNAEFGNPVNKLSLSYIPMMNFDPILDTVKYYSTGNYWDADSPFLRISLGGVSGIFYLDSFSLRTENNSPVSCSISLTNYHGLSGSLASNTPIISDRSPDELYALHSAALDLYSGNSFFYNFFDSINYSMAVEYGVNYTIGRVNPYKITPTLTSENLNIALDTYTAINYSGLSNGAYISNVTGINLYSLSKVFSDQLGTYPYYTFPIYLTGFFVKNSSMNINTNDIVKTEYTFNRFK